MKRCTKCLMSVDPPIQSTVDGVCEWCLSGYPNYQPKGEEAFQKDTSTLPKINGTIRAVVGISGGKDSSYVLHQVKTRHQWDVIAFIYIHPALSPYALENARKICKQLHVSLYELGLNGDVHLKLFHRYFDAWLDDQTPLSASMSCVACKHLFLLGTNLAMHKDASCIIWSDTPLEVPPFLPSQSDSQEEAKEQGTVQLAWKLFKQLCTKRKFRNAFFSDLHTNVLGCLAFSDSTKFIRLRYPKVKQIHYFDYFPWNGQQIRETLLQQTEWRPPSDMSADWHGDCSIHILKEYMMLKMFGMTYMDAFLSNQIRYGLIDRETALETLNKSKAEHVAHLEKAMAQLGLADLFPKIETSVYMN